MIAGFGAAGLVVYAFPSVCAQSNASKGAELGQAEEVLPPLFEVDKVPGIGAERGALLR